MRCRNVCLTLVLLSLASFSFSQNEAKIDSLLTSLKETSQDTNRAKTLDYLSDEYFGYDWAKVGEYSQEGLVLSRKLGFDQGIVNHSSKRGIAYAVAGNSDSAIAVHKEGIALAKATGRMTKAGKMNSNLAQIFTQNSLMDSAMYYHEIGIGLALQTKDTMGMAKSHTGIANIAYSKRNYTKALEGYLEALKLKRAIGAEDTITQINNIGMCYQELGQWEEAKAAFFESLVLSKKQNNFSSQGWANKNLGVMVRNLSEPHEEAEAYFRKAIANFRKSGERSYAAETLLDLGRTQIDLKQYSSAEKTFAESLDIFTELNHGMGTVQSRSELARTQFLLGRVQKGNALLQQAFADEEVIAGMPETASLLYEELLETFSHTGDYRQAFFYSEKNQRLKDSLLQQSRDRDFAEMAEQYEADKREATISLMAENDVLKNKEIKTQKTYLGVVGIGAFLLAGLAFLLYRNSQKRKVANVLLSQQKAEIEKQNDQKAILLKEIHHRVKNNLQIISSLLKLQSKEVDDEAALEALNEGRNRVWSMALIHQRLYQRDELGNIDMQEYIEELVQNIEHSFAKNDKEISIETKLDAVEADVDMAIPLGLILNELITNAYKYAFKGKEKGTIKLGMNLSEERTLSLSVEDDGVGMEEGSMVKSHSFGMKLVKSLSKKLRAEMDVVVDNGTRVVLSIPEFSLAQPVFADN